MHKDLKLVSLKVLTQSRPPTKYGDFTGIFSNTIMPLNGCEPKSDQLWATKLRNPMHGWMGNKAQKESDLTNFSRTSFTTTLTNLCSKTFFSL